jgi:glutathione S-transferase
MNPNQTVPVLRDNGAAPLWETGAILRYLAARYASASFWPKDPALRAEVDKWAEWAKLNVAMAFTGPVFWQVVRTPKAQQNPQAIAAALKALHAKLALAEQQLARAKWLAGAEFTLADIQLGHILFRYFDIEVPRPAWPNLEAYFDQLMRRPAYKTHVALSYEELRGAPPAPSTYN